MQITIKDPTPGLLQMLSTRNDDGTSRLAVRSTCDATILHVDGSDLSELERRHVRATLAAHAVESL